MTFGTCARCGHRYHWWRAPTAASLRELGRAIRDHDTARHPVDEWDQICGGLQEEADAAAVAADGRQAVCEGECDCLACGCVTDRCQCGCCCWPTRRQGELDFGGAA